MDESDTVFAARCQLQLPLSVGHCPIPAGFDGRPTLPSAAHYRKTTVVTDTVCHVCPAAGALGCSHQITSFLSSANPTLPQDHDRSCFDKARAGPSRKIIESSAGDHILAVRAFQLQDAMFRRDKFQKFSGNDGTAYDLIISAVGILVP